MRVIWGTLALFVLVFISTLALCQVGNDPSACDCGSVIYISVVDGTTEVDAWAYINGPGCDWNNSDCYQTASVQSTLTDNFGQVWNGYATDNVGLGGSEVEAWLGAGVAVLNENEIAHSSVYGSYPDSGSCLEWLDGNCVMSSGSDISDEEYTTDSGFDPPLTPLNEYVGWYGYTNGTQGAFYQQVSGIYPNGAYNYTWVQETSPILGSDSCFWPGGPISPNPPTGGPTPVVAGTAWQIFVSPPGVNPPIPLTNDQWGVDVIGVGIQAVLGVQFLGEANGIQFPCNDTVYQSMNYSWDDAPLWTTYIFFPFNTLNQQIGSTTVQACKQESQTGGRCGPQLNQ